MFDDILGKRQEHRTAENPCKEVNLSKGGKVKAEIDPSKFNGKVKTSLPQPKTVMPTTKINTLPQGAQGKTGPKDPLNKDRDSNEICEDCLLDECDCLKEDDDEEEDDEEEYEEEYDEDDEDDEWSTDEDKCDECGNCTGC